MQINELGRRARSIARESMTFHGSGMELGSMLRCTLGVSLAFAAAILSGHPAAGPTAALGAFIGGFISLEGIYRSRFRLIIATALGIALASFIGELALNSLPLLIALTALVGYLNGLFAQWSRVAGAVTLYTSVTFIVFSHLPLSLHASLIQSCYLLAGASVQVVLLILFSPLSRFTIERRAMATSYKELANFADVALDAYTKAPPMAGLVAARQVIADPQPFAHSRDIARFKRLLRDVYVLRSRIAGLHALHAVGNDAQETARANLLAAISLQLHAVAGLLLGQADAEALPRSNECARAALQQFELAFAEDETSLAIARSSLIALRDAVQGSSVIATGRFSPFLFIASPRPDSYIATRIKWKSRESIRLALVLTVAMLIGHTVMAGERGYWIALTAALVLKPDLRSTFVRGLSRIFGTLLGAILALLVLRLHPSVTMLETGMLISGAICYSTFFVNYGLFSVSVTVFVIFFLSLLGFSGDSSISARVLDTLIGGALAMIGYVLLPTWSHKRMREVLADLLEAQAEFTELVLGMLCRPAMFDRAQLERIRQKAWGLRIDAETVLDRAALEPQPADSLALDQALEIMAETQSYALVNLALESAVEHWTPLAAHPQLEAFREQLRRELQDTIRMLRDPSAASSDSRLTDVFEELEQSLHDDALQERMLRLHCSGYLQSALRLRGLSVR